VIRKSRQKSHDLNTRTPKPRSDSQTSLCILKWKVNEARVDHGQDKEMEW